MRENMKKWLLDVPLVLVAVSIWMLPWMLISGSFMGGTGLSENLAPALKGRGGAAAWPVTAHYPTLAAYVELLLDTPQFFMVFWNSCRQVFPVILGRALLDAPATWAFAKFHFRGKKILYTLYIILMLMLFQVIMISSYLILNKMGLTDTARTVILSGVVSTLLVSIMIRFFTDIPAAVMETAAVDKASLLQTLLRFGPPLGASDILSVVVLGSLEYWNAIEVSQAFLKDQALWSLSLCIPNITADNAGALLIVSLITLALPSLIFLFGQKYPEQGIISSGMGD